MTRPAAEYVTDTAHYTPEVIEATKEYARSKPWAGDLEQRIEKLHAFHDRLCEACEMARVEIVLRQPSTDGPSAGRYRALDGKLILYGKLSVVTYLYWFAAALYGIETRCDHARQMTFAVNLYKQCFPRSFANANLTGPSVR